MRFSGSDKNITTKIYSSIAVWFKSDRDRARQTETLTDRQTDRNALRQAGGRQTDGQRRRERTEVAPP